MLEGYKVVIPCETKFYTKYQLYITFSKTPPNSSCCVLPKAQHKGLLKMQVRLAA